MSDMPAPVRCAAALFVALVALVASSAVPASAQTGADDVERRVAQIRAWYGNVQDSVAHFTSREKAFEHPGGGGTILTWHDATGVLRKLVLTFDGDGSSTRAEYFFRDGDDAGPGAGGPFFVYSTTETFRMWPDQDPAEFGVDEDRYYLDGDRLVRWLAKYHAEDMQPRVLPADGYDARADLLLRRADLLRRFAEDDSVSDLYAYDVDGIAF